MTVKERSFIRLLVHVDLALYVRFFSYTVSFSRVPDDHSLVELSLLTSDEDSSYINASFIKVD
jgi:hypothetical protein